MRAFVYQLVERLAEPDSGLTRNRHFALLSSPAGTRARRLLKHLQSLARDAAEPGAQIDVRGVTAEWHVEVRLAAQKLHRQATLSPDDVRVLHRQSGSFPPALLTALRAAGAIP